MAQVSIARLGKVISPLVRPVPSGSDYPVSFSLSSLFQSFPTSLLLYFPTSSSPLYSLFSSVQSVLKCELRIILHILSPTSVSRLLKFCWTIPTTRLLVDPFRVRSQFTVFAVCVPPLLGYHLLVVECVVRRYQLNRKLFRR
jgi:hypothetical protein